MDAASRALEGRRKMKCEHCEHLRSIDSEYHEEFCYLGISCEVDNPFRAFDTGDGCTLTRKQRTALKEFWQGHDYPYHEGEE